MPEYIALIRGINVGRAHRIAMSELRELVEGLGHTDVRTLLNSGNVVFRVARPRVVSATARPIEAGIASTFRIPARVVVISAEDMSTTVRENPLQAIATDPSRHMVAFVTSADTLSRAEPLLERSWAPEAFAIGTKAAYLWCPKGIVDSKLAKAFGRLAGETATTRNWATVLKLQAAASPDRGHERKK